ISIATALRLLDHAPIEDSVREADRMMVVNNTAFRFIEYQAKLRRTLDMRALAALLAQRMTDAA
ncbi:MAG: esterase, partial [Alphaproteobacteria bacterium]|nr:esterase [Alphaproteobacteria bacterium]MDX5369834.1 esterase [Alphaproteobacteria bacterium]MDX5464450.1 esterase [Alphaproteobacteria bacterium]